MNNNISKIGAIIHIWLTVFVVLWILIKLDSPWYINILFGLSLLFKISTTIGIIKLKNDGEKI